jgi:hypothetical protein
MPPGRQFVQQAIADGMYDHQVLHMRDRQALVRS